VFESTKENSRCHFLRQMLKFVEREQLCFSQTLLFKKEKLQFQMQEKGVVQENSKTPTQRKRKQSF
jgi:hypothetical protein